MSGGESRAVFVGYASFEQRSEDRGRRSAQTTGKLQVRAEGQGRGSGLELGQVSDLTLERFGCTEAMAARLCQVGDLTYFR